MRIGIGIGISKDRPPSKNKGGGEVLIDSCFSTGEWLMEKKWLMSTKWKMFKNT